MNDLQIAQVGKELTIPELGVSGYLALSLAPATMRAYKKQWRQFELWCAHSGLNPLPASPDTVAKYMAARAQQGKAFATISQAKYAITKLHLTANQPDPCANELVRRCLTGIRRTHGVAQRQVAPLRESDITAMDTVLRLGVSRRQPKKGGNHPTRVIRDLALFRVQRDGMLRVSELSALRMDDVTREPDGTGRLIVRRSKTDQDGRGVVLYLREQTMVALALWLKERARADGDRVFTRMFRGGTITGNGMTPDGIRGIIKARVKEVGIDGRISGHSARVGMAQDLAAAGASMPELMQAGRWSSPIMVARYTANQTASQGAVAKYMQG